MTQSTLTAAELHDLYAPLWAKVPETQPKWYIDDANHDDGLLIGRSSELSPHNCDAVTEMNAHLCRVACEDWILRQGQHAETSTALGEPFHLVIIPTGDGYRIRRDHWDWIDSDPTNPDGLICGEGRKVLTPEGPTIHHALVAAALTIAAVG